MEMAAPMLFSAIAISSVVSGEAELPSFWNNFKRIFTITHHHNTAHDFAFAVHDARDGSLFCARDPLGCRPFHYVDGEVFAFASTPAALLEKAERSLADAEAVGQRWHGAAGDWLRVWVGPHSPYLCSDELLTGARDLALEALRRIEGFAPALEQGAEITAPQLQHGHDRDRDHDAEGGEQEAAGALRAGVADGELLKVYLNGEEVGSIPYDGTILQGWPDPVLDEPAAGVKRIHVSSNRFVSESGTAMYLHCTLLKQPGYEQFTAVVYFHSQHNAQCQWWVDSSPAALAAFTTMGADPFYNPTGEPLVGIDVTKTAAPSSVIAPGGNVEFTVRITMPPGSRLETTGEVVRAYEEKALELPAEVLASALFNLLQALDLEQLARLINGVAATATEAHRGDCAGAEFQAESMRPNGNHEPTGSTQRSLR